MLARVLSRLLLGLVLLALPGRLLAGEHGDYLMTIPVEGGEPQRLLAEPGTRCGSPRWSPDGEWIAYDTSPYNDQVRRDLCRVFVVRKDGKTDRRVLGPGGMPTWSPDGMDLAWHTYDGSGVMVGRADGSAVESVIARWGNPVWLPNGRDLARLDGRGLEVTNLQTGKSSPLLRTRYALKYGYSISPEGDRASLRTADGRLIVARFGGEPQFVRLSIGETEYSSWSPNGRRLAISWKPPGEKKFQLYTVAVDGDEKPGRVPGQEAGVSNLQPDWSPDGRTLVYRRAVQNK